MCRLAVVSANPSDNGQNAFVNLECVENVLENDMRAKSKGKGRRVWQFLGEVGGVNRKKACPQVEEAQHGGRLQSTPSSGGGKRNSTNGDNNHNTRNRDDVGVRKFCIAQGDIDSGNQHENHSLTHSLLP